MIINSILYFMLHCVILSNTTDCAPVHIHGIPKVFVLCGSGEIIEDIECMLPEDW